MEIGEYERYGRQMIVPEIGLFGQQSLRRSRVLVVGAGGLGCPAIAYLAGAGVGCLGIVDGDTVEVSNLHRQILHTTPGIPKTESAALYVAKLNPNVVVEQFNQRITAENAEKIVKSFDLVLDCTDAPATRYLINDCCVLLNKRLVSAAALRSEGQLAVYCADAESPCYRCLFPVPPPPELVGSCGDAGIIGPVVGLLGVYQAAEAIRLLVVPKPEPRPPSLSLFSLFAFPQWKQVKVRKRQPNCAVCGTSPTITSLTSVDYVEFCGSVRTPSEPAERLSALEVQKRITDGAVVLDVRPRTQFGICALPNSVNMPLTDLRRFSESGSAPPPELLKHANGATLIVACRYGNDSREAVELLAKMGIRACDLRGGLNAYSEVDPQFPRY